MNEAQKVRIAAALFAAQNQLGMEWQNRNTGTSNDLEMQELIENVQRKIRIAVKELGGVDYLLEIGA